MQYYIRLNDYAKLFGFTGPFFAFIVPWLLVLLGQTFPLCDIIVPEYSVFYLVVLGNMLSILLLGFAIQIFFPQNLSTKMAPLKEMAITERFKKVVILLLSFYLICQVFQVIYFKGVPLFWLIMKSDKTYFDYGINSLNGLLNAIFLLASTGYYLIYLNRPSKGKLFVLLSLFALPILLVSRQLLISLTLQIACCSIIYSPKSIRKFFIFGIVLAAIFIFVGNFRTGMSTLVQILQPKDFVPPFLYPLLWIYAYVMTPFNNINATIDFVRPIGAPYYEISSLVPSTLRSMIDMGNVDTGYAPVHMNMTVSTFYFEPILDFGAAYSFVFMAVFQFFFLLSYRKALKGQSLVHVIEYSIFYMIAILSIFSNLLLYLPVISQLVILNLAKLRIFRKKNILVLSAESKV